MRNLLLTVAGACLAMLVTSGIVALATASSPEPEPVPAPDVTVAETAVAQMTDEQIEERISDLIDAQHRLLALRR